MIDTNKSTITLIKCPNILPNGKICNHEFATKKEKYQCSSCGKRGET